MDRDVAFEVGVVVTLPEHEERLPPTPRKAGVRGQGDADVEVEDLLVQPVRVERCVEEDQRDRGRRKDEGQPGERRQAVIP